jgi:syntaxin 16
MATRDRTAEFVKFRTARQRLGADKQNLLGKEMTQIAVAPRWVEKLQEFRSLEKDIKSTTQDLEAKRKAHLKVEFSTARNEEEEEEEIESLQGVLDSMFKDTEKQIKELDECYLEDLGDDEPTHAELSIIRNIKICLINEVQALGKVYRENQRRYVADVKKKKYVRDRLAGGDEQKKVEDDMRRDAEADGYLQAGMTRDQIDAIMLNRQMVEDRVKEFQKIYHSISQLRDMFKDLNDLVIDSGTVLDRIDHNMTIAHKNVKEGVAELVEAKKIQEAGTYKLCVMFLVILILGFLLALMFKAVS